MHAADLFLQFLVANSARRRRRVLCGVIGSRSDLHTGLIQDPTNRLDPEFLAFDNTSTVVIDVFDNHREWHLALRGAVIGYLILRSSSAAAKKAAEVRSISLVLRSSRFSRSNCAIRSSTWDGTPGRCPPSTSARLTHVRSASGWMSNWPAIRRITTIRLPSAAIASNAIRVARSRNSSLYFRCLAMTPHPPGIRACKEPGAQQGQQLEAGQEEGHGPILDDRDH